MNTKKDDGNCLEENVPIFRKTCSWLYVYFSRKVPIFTPKYKIDNLGQFSTGSVFCCF